MYPCVSYQNEVSELWQFDVPTYQWQLVNTSIWGSAPPPAREQHSASTIAGSLYVFGGKSRTYTASVASSTSTSTSTGAPVKDTVYGDLWRLDLPRTEQFSVNTSGSAKNVALSETQRMFSSIRSETANGIAGVTTKLGDGISKRAVILTQY